MNMAIDGPIILDLNTQRDFFYPDGAQPLYQAEALIDPLKKVFGWAHRMRIPIVSTRMHGVVVPGSKSGVALGNPSSAGYKKMPSTLIRRRQEMPLDCGTSLPVEGFRLTQQFIFDLTGMNPFECPRLDRILSEAEGGTWVLVGGPLEWSVRMAVLGLLQRRHKVALVKDAIGMMDPYEGDMALRQIESKNVEWLTADQLQERFTKPRPRPSVPRRRVVAIKPPAPAKPAPRMKKNAKAYRIS